MSEPLGACGGPDMRNASAFRHASEAVARLPARIMDRTPPLPEGRGFSAMDRNNVRAPPGREPERGPPVDNLRLHTHVRRDAPHPVLAVAGEIDVFTAPLFKQAVVNLVAEGHRHLFLDMRE